MQVFGLKSDKLRAFFQNELTARLQTLVFIVQIKTESESGLGTSSFETANKIQLCVEMWKSGKATDLPSPFRKSRN
jgi:hypothetical protein